MASLILDQGIGDLYRIYTLAERDELDFNLAAIPQDFDEEKTEQFDTVYVRKLFDLGYGLAKHGYPWKKEPLDF